MPAHYGPDAIDYCLRLYLKYNGQQHKKIEQEMRKAGWEGWSATNLHNKGRGKKLRLGWIEKYRWDHALEVHLAQKVTATATLNNAEKLVREVENIRELLYKEIYAHGAVVERERLQLHRDYCNLSIAALTKVESARDTLGAWVNFWERLQEWAVDIDAKFGRYLIKHSDAVIARAEAEFGEENADRMNGSANSEDQGTDDRAEA